MLRKNGMFESIEIEDKNIEAETQEDMSVPKPVLSDVAYAECENAALTRLCKIKQHES